MRGMEAAADKVKMMMDMSEHTDHICCSPPARIKSLWLSGELVRDSVTYRVQQAV
jgi:hypothetical protein